MISVVCPVCNTNSSHEINKDADYDLACPECDKKFSSVIGTVKSKRSRGNKKEGRRSYDIRYLQEGQECFLQFESDQYEDVELRSKDRFVLSYYAKKPRILENKTISRYWQVNPQPVGLVAALVSTLILLFLGWMIVSWLF